MTHAILFGTALLFSLLLTPLVRAFALRIGVFERAEGDRKLEIEQLHGFGHARPIPKLGGVAIFVTFYGTVACASFWLNVDGADAAFDLAGRCFGPSLLILALGIADDLIGVPPVGKVAVQVLAAAWIFSYPDLRIQGLSIPLGDASALGWFSLPATIFWIVLMTNAFNIVDGMDGLASGVGFVAITCLFVATLQREHPYLPILVAPMGGALLGFLRYNFNPASIFLGDSGSLWLGFMLAVFSIAGYQKSSTAIAVAAPLLMLALPLIETATSAARRFLKGQPIFQADSGHIHHQLLRKGLSARRAAILLYLGSGLFGAASLFLVESNHMVVGVTTLALGLVAWLGIQQLGYSEFIEVNNAFKRGFLYQRRIIQNSILTRKLAEDLRKSNSLAEAWPRLLAVVDNLQFMRIEIDLDPSAVLSPETQAQLRSGSFPTWFSSERLADSQDRDWFVYSVHLVERGQNLGRVVLWRSREADQLHSELALLIETIAEHLPHLLGHAPVLSETSRPQQSGAAL